MGEKPGPLGPQWSIPSQIWKFYLQTNARDAWISWIRSRRSWKADLTTIRRMYTKSNNSACRESAMYYEAVEQAAAQGEVLGRYLVHILQTTGISNLYGLRYNLNRFFISLQLKCFFFGRDLSRWFSWMYNCHPRYAHSSICNWIRALHSGYVAPFLVAYAFLGQCRFGSSHVHVLASRFREWNLTSSSPWKLTSLLLKLLLEKCCSFDLTSFFVHRLFTVVTSPIYRTSSLKCHFFGVWNGTRAGDCSHRWYRGSLVSTVGFALFLFPLACFILIDTRYSLFII